jgi:hypothetical protein
MDAKEALDMAEKIMSDLAANCLAKSLADTGDDEKEIISRALSELQARSYSACAEIIRDMKRQIK